MAVSEHVTKQRPSKPLRDTVLPTPAVSTAHVGDRPPASPPLRLLLIVADQAAILLGWLAANSAAGLLLPEDRGLLTVLAQVSLVMAAGGLLLSYAGLYRRRVSFIRAQEVARSGRVALGLAALTLVLFAPQGRDTAIAAASVGLVSWFLLLVLERGTLREWIQVRRASGDFAAPVLVLGGAGVCDTVKFLNEHPVLGFEVRGVLSPRPETPDQMPIPWLGPSTNVAAAVARTSSSGVVLDAATLTGGELTSYVRRLSTAGLHVHIASGLRGVRRRRISLIELADETFLNVAPLGLTRRQVIVKRAIDLIVGSLALLVLSPAILVAMLAIKLSDGGPVLFVQERVGLDGARFPLYKLRTMVVDAEARLAELQESNQRGGPLFKASHDPRITPFGRFLRASSLDEAPQLINVLQGSMSLVGPRPALPSEVAQFDEELLGRLAVKPGLTGPWQVEARDLPSFDLYRRYDLMYAEDWSVGLDLVIIARTAAVVIVRLVTAVLPSRRSDTSVLP